MNLPSDTPRMPKWIFLCGDAALVLTAVFIARESQNPASGLPLVLIVACVAVAAVIGCIPFVTDYAGRVDEALDNRQRALEALSVTVASASEQVSIAATGLQGISEAAQENFGKSERLSLEIQEKIAQLDKRLSEAKRAEEEASARFESVSRKLAKAAAELEASAARATEAARLLAEAPRPEPAPLPSAAFVEIRPVASSSDSPFEANPSLPAAEAVAPAAPVESALPQPLVPAEIPAPAPAPRKRSPRKPQPAAAPEPQPEAPVAEAAPAALPEAAPAPVAGTLSAEAPAAPAGAPAPGDPPQAGPAKDPEPAAPPEAALAANPSPAPKPEEPAPAPEAQPAPAAEAPLSPVPAAPQAEPAPQFAPETAPAPPAEAAAETPAELQAPAPEAAAAPPPAPRKRAPRKPAAPPVEAALPVADLVLEPVPADEPAAPAAPEPAEPALSADGATRLIVTAYIGIGNRLFIRGEGPGLSWEKGVPLTFVSIGKWRWETNDATTSVRFRLFKNDQQECTALGQRTVEPGAQLDLSAAF